MHIQKLKVLVEVAKTGSITIAAQNLHLSQSGISQIITKLEEELGIKVFDRSRHGVLSTRDGTKIVKKANEVLLKYEELIGEAQKILEVHSGILRVSSLPVFTNFLIKLLMDFRKLYSNSTIEILDNTTECTMDFIDQDKADIGLICIYGEILKNIEDLNIDVILEGKMKVYVCSDSPLACKKTITPEEVLNQKIVLYNGDYAKWFIQNFQLTFGKVNILFSSNNTEELLRSISNGSAISFAPDFALKNNPFLFEGKIAEIELDIINYAPTNVSLGLIHPKKRYYSTIEKDFTKLLKTELYSYLR